VFLTAHGIPCRMVPGVTSAVAAAASSGIPVTHRSVASGFTVVTAHAKDDEPLSIDFGQLLDERRTVVFLMGLARVGEIAASLTKAGRNPATPAAVVSAATTPEERTVVGTLANIAERTVRAGLVSPAVLVVGDVVGLPPKLGLPLMVQRILVPVIEGGSMRLGERLRALGAKVDEVTVGRIERIKNALGEGDLDGIDRILLTSKNGWLGLDEELLAAAQKRSIRIESVREVKPGGRVLHLTQPDAERVKGVRSIDVYRNTEVLLVERICLPDYDAAVFTCASSVRRVFARADGQTHVFAIGPKTARALDSAGALDIVCADRPTLDSLVDRIVCAQRFR